MKSKAHFKKCSELGINPDTLMIEYERNEFLEDEKRRQENMNNGREIESRPDSEEDDNETDDEDDESSEGKSLNCSTMNFLMNFLFIHFSITDTDESKSRMPEHEAAQLLLSLSNQTTATNSVAQSISQQSIVSSNWSEPQETQTLDALQQRNRVIMSGIKATGDFDLLNHEKYYSDPSLNRPKEIVVMKPIAGNESEDDDVPMDLTKKPKKTEISSQQTIRVADVISKISEPLLIKNLMVNIDKMPANPNMNFTDNVQFNDNLLPQEYITERALKDVRMKQSQHMNKTNSDYSHLAMFALNKDIVASAAEETSPIYVRQNMNSSHSTTSSSTSSSPPSTTPVVNNKNGLMDTLADLAAKSDKLEVKEQSSKSTTNAKNVASEILKFTQQKTVTRNFDESSDALSDQESQEASAAFMLTPQTIVVGGDGFHKKTNVSGNNSNNEQLLYNHLQDDAGRPVCVNCKKVFQKPGQLRIHMNIHYMERKYRCEACGVSFRTQGHLQKHERSVSHQNKVNMTSTFGVPTLSNPRPFNCKDCKIAFRIHGHLAKHLRSKMHVLKLECLQKLPFGTYAEMERSGFNLTDIDTSDCDNSLMSLRQLAKKLNEKDPSKLGPLPPLSEDPSENDENGNENYDSDSSDLGTNTNMTDEDSLKRKINDTEDIEMGKRIKIANENDKIVPSNSSPAI
jgi:human immunodeficiency virus type I enhancer-binding protein